MNLLQSEIVDEKKVRLEFFKSTDAGSMAAVGLGGGTPSSSLLQSVHTPAKTEIPNIFTTNFDELLNSEFRAGPSAPAQDSIVGQYGSLVNVDFEMLN